MPDLTLVFVTMGRPECALRLVRSVRQFYPSMPVIMVEQVDGDSELGRAVANDDVMHLVVPFDAGLSLSRNLALPQVRTQYFVLADDDFVFTQETRFETTTRFMESHRQVVFVGGTLNERRPERRGKPSLRARNIAIDNVGKGVLLMPAENISPTVTFEDQRFVFCNMVPNWGIGCTAQFQSNGLRWDEAFKIGGEHLDFFLSLLARSELQVAFNDSLTCDHYPESTPSYGTYRYREDWADQLLAKWGFRYLYPIGGYVRWLHDIRGREAQAFNPMETARLNALKNRLLNVAEANRKLKQRIEELENVNRKIRGLSRS